MHYRKTPGIKQDNAACSESVMSGFTTRWERETGKQASFSLPLVALLALLLATGTQCDTPYAKAANLDSSGKAIICFGDSITRGYGARRGNDYPARLSALLNRPVINAGADGDTTEAALARLERDVLRRSPRLVIIELTGNDLLERVPREKTFANLDAIVARCVDAGAMVILVHCRFGLFGDPYLKGFKTIAKKRHAILVQDALAGVFGNPKYMYDQIHPNDDGYELLAERVAGEAGSLLAEADMRATER